MRTCQRSFATKRCSLNLSATVVGSGSTVSYTLESDPPLSADELTASGLKCTFIVSKSACTECADTILSLKLVDELQTGLSATPHNGTFTPTTAGTHELCVHFSNSILEQFGAGNGSEVCVANVL